MKLFFKNGRLNTFKNWRLDKEGGAVCTSERLADAGFYSTATATEPDSAKCIFCLKELIWEKEDDPWTEHRSRAGCPFVNLNKLENEWTVKDILELFVARDTKIKMQHAKEALDDYYVNSQRIVDNVKKCIGS
uniref:Uncharacterized protein n=1 Tax=Acrobeloides nanus TaxID=290746 RepID=A0A914D6R5_9BILA